MRVATAAWRMPFAALDARRRSWLVIAALVLLMFFSVIYSVTLGRYGVSMTNAWLILWNHVIPVANPTWTDVDANVVTAVRLPRILGALLVGAGLGISGAALQGLFRNPLVDPGLVGVTAGAGFGGTLAILLVGGRTVVLGASVRYGSMKPA